jgi:hypothetical protein
MPCRTEGGDTYESAHLRRILDDVTRMLCAVLREREEGTPNPYTAELAQWWDRHKEADARRLAREQEEAQRKEQRQAALSKLTPEERKALNL